MNYETLSNLTDGDIMDHALIIQQKNSAIEFSKSNMKEVVYLWYGYHPDDPKFKGGNEGEYLQTLCEWKDWYYDHHYNNYSNSNLKN